VIFACKHTKCSRWSLREDRKGTRRHLPAQTYIRLYGFGKETGKAKNSSSIEREYNLRKTVMSLNIIDNGYE
jgi:hypothetical protein